MTHLANLWCLRFVWTLPEPRGASRGNQFENVCHKRRIQNNSNNKFLLRIARNIHDALTQIVGHLIRDIKGLINCGLITGPSDPFFCRSAPFGASVDITLRRTHRFLKRFKYLKFGKNQSQRP